MTTVIATALFSLAILGDGCNSSALTAALRLFRPWGEQMLLDNTHKKEFR